MGKISRNKGNSFERLVSKMVVSAFPGATAKDCYRTPLSGGHPIADAGDLVISDRLRKVFPYVVECKHVKDWRMEHAFLVNNGMQKWLRQTVAAVARSESKGGKGLQPLLVMHGNLTGTYCTAPSDLQVRKWLMTNKRSSLRFYFDDQAWELLAFADFLTFIGGPQTYDITNHSTGELRRV